MKRVLHIVGSIELGGIQSFLMNLYRNIDRNLVQFDFVICDEPSEESYKSEIELLGGKIYRIPTKSESLYKNLKSIYDIVKKEKYSIVWRHTPDSVRAIDLIPAKFAGADKLILHSHCAYAYDINGRIGSIFKNIFLKIPTDLIACGEDAGKYMFDKQPYIILENGIDVKKFVFDTEIRSRLRNELGISRENNVYGHVGRLSEPKNHVFLLEIFKHIAENDSNAVLLLVGDGDLYNLIVERINQLNLNSKVKLLGARQDINNLMMAMDFMIFPSLYEGMPVTLVETQATGLHCMVSDRVTKECNVSDTLFYYSLNKTSDEWANEATLGLAKALRRDRTHGALDVMHSNYNIQNVVSKLYALLGE